jgi:ketosteroid isomerase-like protein
MAFESRSTRLNTAYSLLDAYGALSPDAILSHLDEDCTHQALPASLEMPPRSKEEFRGHAQGITSIFTTFAMIPQNVYEDHDNNAVVIHAIMDGQLNKPGMGQWKNECIMLLRFTPDGSKITQIREFVDSAKAMEMRNKVKPKNFASHDPTILSTLGWVVSTTVPAALAGAALLYLSGRRDLFRNKRR